jgi:hypothetical protein
MNPIISEKQWRAKRLATNDEWLCPCDHPNPEECETCRGACSCHFTDDAQKCPDCGCPLKISATIISCTFCKNTWGRVNEQWVEDVDSQSETLRRLPDHE